MPNGGDIVAQSTSWLGFSMTQFKMRVCDGLARLVSEGGFLLGVIVGALGVGCGGSPRPQIPVRPKPIDQSQIIGALEAHRF